MTQLESSLIVYSRAAIFLEIHRSNDSHFHGHLVDNPVMAITAHPGQNECEAGFGMEGSGSLHGNVSESEPASIMCALPEINGVSACSNEDLLKTTLRENRWFQGYVITDRRAVHDTAPSIKAGVDWELSHMTPPVLFT
jgi:beta-glucosidase-like glycosyl hydrolase